MRNQGHLHIDGTVHAERVVNLGDLRTSAGIARAPLSWRLKNFVQHRRRSVAQVAAVRAVGKVFGVIAFLPELKAARFTPNWKTLGMAPADVSRIKELLALNVPIPVISSLVPNADRWLRLQELLRDNTRVGNLAAAFGGQVLDFGLVSQRKVTTAGVGFLVDAWQNSVELENMKYHGVGTGTNAEDNTDTALQTESTTALNPDSTRATGSTTEGSGANVFRSVGTVTFDASAAITEHGIFSQAATGGGVLWDRSVFSAINVVSADSIQFTYDLTASAEA